MEKPKVVISVQGGVVISVHSNSEVDVVLYDWDNICEDDQYADDPDHVEQMEFKFELEVINMKESPITEPTT